MLRALSDDFTSTPALLPIDMVDNWLQKIMHTTTIIKQDKLFGVLAKHTDAAVCILLETFTELDEQFQKDIFDFIIAQLTLHEQNWPYEADANLLRLIMKVVDLIDHDSCVILASSIFASNSRIWLYRFLYSNSVNYEFVIFFIYISFMFIAYSRCFTSI